MRNDSHAARLLFALLAVSFALQAQAVRYDTVSTTNTQCASGVQCPILAIPGTAVKVCQGTPSAFGNCITATTYTSQTALTSCPTTAQITLPVTSGTTCLSGADDQGNVGFWALPGSYSYFLTRPGELPVGPFPINAGATAGCPLGATCDADYSTLAAAFAAAGSGTLYITRSWNLQTTATYSSPMTCLGNGKIQPASGQVITFTGSISAAPNQPCFDTTLAGAASIVVNSATEAQVTWFVGADPTFTTDSRLAIQSCIYAHPTTGFYSGNGTITNVPIRFGNCVFPSSGTFGVSGTVYVQELQRITIPVGTSVKFLANSTSSPKTWVFQVLPTQGSRDTPSPNITQNVNIVGGGTIDCNGSASGNNYAAGVLFYGSEFSRLDVNIANCVTGGRWFGQSTDSFVNVVSDSIISTGWTTGISETGTNAPGIGLFIHGNGIHHSGPVQGFNGGGGASGDCITSIKDPEVCVWGSNNAVIESPAYGECESSFLQDYASAGTTLIGGEAVTARNLTGCPSTTTGLYAIYLSPTTTGFSTANTSTIVLDYGIALYDASSSLSIAGNATGYFLLQPYAQQRVNLPGGIDNVLTPNVSALRINVATEITGSANNALVVTLPNVDPETATCFTIQLGHALQAGTNTIVVNGATAVGIKSHFNTSKNLGTAYASNGVITLCRERRGVYVDMSQ